MTPAKRKEIENRRILLRQKLQAEEFVEDSVFPFLEILQALKDHNVNFDIVTVTNILPEWKIFLDEKFSESPFSEFELNKIPHTEEGFLIDDLLDCYPSVNQIRYVPDLPLMPQGMPFKTIIKSHRPENQLVNFYYFRYPFILELELSELIKIDGEELFTFWHGDAVIFPKNHEWLIAYSLEEEWRCGQR